MNNQESLQQRKAMYILVATIVVLLAVAAIGLLFMSPQSEYIEGEAEANEYRVSSKVPGRILKFYVSEGDWVKPGDTLVSLQAPEVLAKLTQVEAIESAAKALNEKSHSSARKEVVQSAYEMWQKAKAGLEVAQKSYDRINQLYKEGVMSAQQYDEAKANLNAMAATEKAARWQYKMAVDGAQKEDREITAAQVREAKGGVAEVNSYVEEMILTAPMEGEVSEIFPQPDELVGSGAPIMNITLMKQMWATFNVREDKLKQLSIGKEITAYSPALDLNITLKIVRQKDLGTYAAWKATKVTGEFDLKTFEVKALPSGYINGLRPGMSLVIKE